MRNYFSVILLLLLSIYGCGKGNIKEEAFSKLSGMVKKTFDENSVKVIVDTTDVIADIKPEAIRGVNLNNAMQVAKIKDKAAQLKIPTITYPAGNIGDERDCNSENDLRFFSLQQLLVGKPFTFAQIRVFGGTPEKAIESIETAKKVGVRVDVWSIGNEPDLYYKNKAPEWTPEYYSKKFREIVEAMRSKYPDIKVAGPMVSQPKDDWIRTFIKENGDLVDVLAWHWYPTSGNEDSEYALSTAERIKDQIQTYRTLLKDPSSNPKGYKRDIKLALTEYATHWNTPNSRHIGDIVGGLWLAEVMGYLAQYKIDFSHYFCFGTYGGHSLFEPDTYFPRPTYWVIYFYANYFGNKLLNSISSDEKLKVFASTDSEGAKYILLINKSANIDKQVSINLLNNSSPTKEVKMYTLSWSETGAKTNATEIAAFDGKTITINVPKYTVNAVVIK